MIALLVANFDSLDTKPSNDAKELLRDSMGGKGVISQPEGLDIVSIPLKELQDVGQVFNFFINSLLRECDLESHQCFAEMAGPYREISEMLPLSDVKLELASSIVWMRLAIDLQLLQQV